MARGCSTTAGAAPYVPAGARLDDLRRASTGCRGCQLYRRATQTVFGAGDAGAPVMLVGEQPGDREDRQGEPFVGPAGNLLREALSDAEIDPAATYLTNAVKHFKWEPRGKVRLHKTPSVGEVAACRPWLDAELRAVRPRLVVCLGATAAQALLGRTFRVTKGRGQVFAGPGGVPVLATVHPSAVLRAGDPEARRRQRAAFVDDLRRAAYLLEHPEELAEAPPPPG